MESREQLQTALSPQPQPQQPQSGAHTQKEEEEAMQQMEETHDQAPERVVAGYVWKCPSEGTNEQPSATAADAFPRRCSACQSAWVSSYEAEWRHWQTCMQHAQEATAREKNFGVARRVWCEVDDSRTFLQWRSNADSEQDETVCRIALDEIRQVAMLDKPVNSVQVVTSMSRVLVFECRSSEAEDSPALDAAQLLSCLSSYVPAPVDPVAGEQNQPHGSPPNSADPPEQFLRAIWADNSAELEAIWSLEGQPRRWSAWRDAQGSSLLVLALQCGAGPDVLRKLLRMGVDPNATNNELESPLLLLAASGDSESMRLMLQADGIVVNQRCALGATAVHAAANAGDVKILQLLCDAGATPFVVDDNGWTALHYVAVCSTGLDAMRFLCELIPEVVDYASIDGNTALHMAAGFGCADNVRTLLETAANPHILNQAGLTAYHVALHNNKIACAITLHEYMQNSSCENYEMPVDVQEPAPEYSRPSQAKTHQPKHLNRPLDEDEASSSEGVGVFPQQLDDYWMECMDANGLPYYYNSVTQESTWHRPSLQKDTSATKQTPQRSAWNEVDGDQDQCAADPLTEPATSSKWGHQLPLCMIPMVSPLMSLDDPLAADKIELKRRKARLKRRVQVQRHRLKHRSPRVE